MANTHFRALPTVSSLAKRGICFFFLPFSLSLAVPVFAQNPLRRPRILGIAGVSIITGGLSDSKDFYSKVLTQDHPCLWCGQPPIPTFSVDSIQYIQLGTNLLDEITFETDDVPGLWKYLLAQGVTPVSLVPEMSDDPQKQQLMAYAPSQKLPPDVYFSVLDPEGHKIAFVQIPSEAHRYEPNGGSMRLVQAGFLVNANDREEEDHFYKDMLGFRSNPHGEAEGATGDLADLLVPDGTDGIRYLPDNPPSGAKCPHNAVCHIVVGVTDVAQLKYEIGKRGLPLGEPEIGRDGKWQLNLYDPDGTRVELMEFTPVQDPCCSPYTGPHPKP